MAARVPGFYVGVGSNNSELNRSHHASDNYYTADEVIRQIITLIGEDPDSLKYLDFSALLHVTLGNNPSISQVVSTLTVTDGGGYPELKGFSTKVTHIE